MNQFAPESVEHKDTNYDDERGAQQQAVEVLRKSGGELSQVPSSRVEDRRWHAVEGRPGHRLHRPGREDAMTEAVSESIGRSLRQPEDFDDQRRAAQLTRRELREGVRGPPRGGGRVAQAQRIAVQLARAVQMGGAAHQGQPESWKRSFMRWLCARLAIMPS